MQETSILTSRHERGLLALRAASTAGWNRRSLTRVEARRPQLGRCWNSKRAGSYCPSSYSLEVDGTHRVETGRGSAAGRAGKQDLALPQTAVGMPYQVKQAEPGGQSLYIAVTELGSNLLNFVLRWLVQRGYSIMPSEGGQTDTTWGPTPGAR